MFRRRRYGTPIHPWTRQRRFRLPRIPRSREAWSALVRTNGFWPRAIATVFALVIGGSVLGSAVAPAPLPDLAARDGQIVVDGAVLPRLRNWAMYRPTPGLERPWILYAPGGEAGSPPATITIYAPVVTELVDDIIARNGEGSLDRETLLVKILEAWASDPTTSLDIPAPSFSPITSGVGGERFELAVRVDFASPFPYAPVTASAAPTPSASASASTDTTVGPLLALPTRGEPTDQQVMISLAAYLPSVDAFDAPARQRMLVITLTYDASLPADRIAAYQAGFEALITRIQFP
jgi:hypothetical protein